MSKIDKIHETVEEWKNTIEESPSYYHQSDLPVVLEEIEEILESTICPNCGSYDVHQPHQTMDMPMNMECRACDYIGATEEFTNG